MIITVETLLDFRVWVQENLRESLLIPQAIRLPRIHPFTLDLSGLSVRLHPLLVASVHSDYPFLI